MGGRGGGEEKKKRARGNTHFPNCLPFNALSFCVQGLMMLSLGEMYLFVVLLFLWGHYVSRVGA